MRISFFGNGLFTVGGGVSQYFLCLAENLSRFEGGHRITIVSCGEEIPERKNNNITYVSLGSEVATEIGYIRFAIKTLQYFLYHRDFDVLHAGGSNPLMLFFPKILTALTGIPLVFTVSAGNYPNGIFSHMGCKRFILTSRRMLSGKKSADRCQYIPPFVEVAKFRDAHQYSFRGDHDFVVGVSGSLLGRKGHRYLIKAIPEVVERYPKVLFVLAVNTPSDSVNTGRKEMERLNNFIGKRRLNRNVIIMGKVDIPMFMRSIDVFVLTYLTSKGSFDIPLSILESLAGGVALISTRIGSIDEVIRDGHNGLLIDKEEMKNPSAYARRIIQLLDNKLLLNRIRKNAHASVSKFDIDRYIPEMLKLYQEISRGDRRSELIT